MELIELARGTWGDALLELSREYGGCAARVGSSRADGSLRPTSPPHGSLQGLCYDEARSEVEVAIGLAACKRPSLRCFVSEPQRIFIARRKGRRSIVIFDRSGTRTLIQLADASAARGTGFADEGGAPADAVARVER